MRRITPNQSGFTILELSIVMAIVAMVLGGLFFSKTVIRNAELRRVVSDIEKYDAAVNTFQLKYRFLPGDTTTATRYWGAVWGSASDNYTATCFANSDNGTIGATATCNGNGDGMIGGGYACTNVSFFNIAATCGNEQYSIWQHLANAKLVPGQFVPSRGGHSSLTKRNFWLGGSGGNMPSSQHNPLELFAIQYVCNYTNTIFANVCGHYIFYGGQSSTPNLNANDFPMWPAFSSDEARSIDQKLDDGTPGNGRVMTLRFGAPYVGGSSCATTATASTAVYDTSTGPRCGLMFKASF